MEHRGSVAGGEVGRDQGVSAAVGPLDCCLDCVAWDQLAVAGHPQRGWGDDRHSTSGPPLVPASRGVHHRCVREEGSPYACLAFPPVRLLEGYRHSSAQ
eukprot:4195990-Prorocentrum_lima.AAC.1